MPLFAILPIILILVVVAIFIAISMKNAKKFANASNENPDKVFISNYFDGGEFILDGKDLTEYEFTRDAGNKVNAMLEPGEYTIKLNGKMKLPLSVIKKKRQQVEGPTKFTFTSQEDITVHALLEAGKIYQGNVIGLPGDQMRVDMYTNPNLGYKIVAKKDFDVSDQYKSYVATFVIVEIPVHYKLKK